MKIVAISDTHGLERQIAEIPAGDVLIHAGDLTDVGKIADVKAFAAWSKSLPHQHKVIIAGNHDFCFEQHDRKGLYTPEAKKLLKNVGWIYLHDESVTIEGFLFYGSPYQPWFHDWAFNLERGEPLKEKWELIPNNTDVLITHGPPYGILDRTEDGRNVGCEELDVRLSELSVKAHVFGHIHEAYGTIRRDGTIFVNACICDLDYRPINPPIVFEL